MPYTQHDLIFYDPHVFFLFRTQVGILTFFVYLYSGAWAFLLRSLWHTYCTYVLVFSIHKSSCWCSFFLVWQFFGCERLLYVCNFNSEWIASKMILKTFIHESITTTRSSFSGDTQFSHLGSDLKSVCWVDWTRHATDLMLWSVEFNHMSTTFGGNL